MTTISGYKSQYDLDDIYRNQLISLMRDAASVARQYSYEDLEGCVGVESFMRNINWFLEGLLPKMERYNRGVREHQRLRGNCKNYYAIYRENGLLRKVICYVDGDKDMTFYVVYKGNRRYLLPFSDGSKTPYPFYTIVTEFAGNEVKREYLVHDNQIIYYAYNNHSNTQYKVEVINYVQGGKYPVLSYESGIIDVVNLAYKRDEKVYSWYQEYSCSKKDEPYTILLPEHMKSI